MLPTHLHARHWALLALFLLALLLFDLGSRGLNEPDEGRYADIALEMLQPGHSWWDPSMLDIGHYDKPPLIYWTTAVSFELFGLNEWAARLPSLLGAILTLGGLAWAAGRLYGARLAWLATLVGGTLFHIWGMGRELSPDMLMTGCCTLAIAAWAETRQRGGAWPWWLLQVLFWTLALWTKATPALVPMLGLVLYVYFAGGRAERRALRLPLLLPLALVLASPWFLVVMHWHPALVDFFFHRELVGRMTGHVTGRRGPIYYYLPVSLATWLPWWPLALAAALRQRDRLRAGWHAGRRVWGPEVFLVVTGLIAFSLTSSKLPTYTLPLAPWAALLMARLLAWEPRFLSTPVLGGVAGAAAAVYLAIGILSPHYEASFGRNSSIRPVVDYIRRQGPGGIRADHLYFSLEFYGGANFFFVYLVPPVEIDNPRDQPALHFDANGLGPIAPGDWFIHYRKQPTSPFQKWIDDPKVPKKIIGDFIVGPLS